MPAKLLNIKDLRRFLEEAGSTLGRLRARADSALAELASLESELDKILRDGGAPGRGRGRRLGRPKGTGARGGKPGRRGRPPKAEAGEAPVKRRNRRPKAAVAEVIHGSAEVAPEAAPTEEPREDPKPSPAERGPSLADLIEKALIAAGKPLTVPDLTSAVEEMGYESKNTSQVIRMTAGRGGRFKKMEGDVVGMA